MSLGFPLGMLALAGLLPLAAAYFLRRKQRPMKVSALFLWRDPNPTAEAGPKFERFTRELSFLLEALAIIAAALFLADLRFGASANEKHLVVVVDGSLSMSAKTATGPVTERVRQSAAAVVEREGATVVSIVESGVSPRLIAGPHARASEALAQLESWSPMGASHDLSPALLLARELAGAGKRIILFTDAPLPETTARPGELEVVAVGEPAANVALVAAQRRDIEGVAKISARVVNFSNEARTVQVTFEAKAATGTAPIRKAQEVALEPGGNATVEVSFQGAADITVSLPDDALAVDGRAVLVPSAEPRVYIRTLAGLDAAAVSALSRFATVAANVKLGAADAGVEDALLTFGPRESTADVTVGAPGEQRSFVGPFFTDKTNPLFEDVDLSGVRWTAGSSPPGRGRITAGQVALLGEDDDGRVHLNIDLSRSNIHRTFAWPVLMANLVRRARTNVAGLPRRQLLLGEEVPVVTGPNGRYVLKGPGYERPVLGVGRVSLAPLSKPGSYVLERDGALVDRMEVLSLDARESDLSDRSTANQSAVAGDGPASRALPQPRNVYPLLVMLSLLLADFFITRRATA